MKFKAKIIIESIVEFDTDNYDSKEPNQIVQTLVDDASDDVDVAESLVFMTMQIAENIIYTADILE